MSQHIYYKLNSVIALILTECRRVSNRSLQTMNIPHSVWRWCCHVAGILLISNDISGR